MSKIIYQDEDRIVTIDVPEELQTCDEVVMDLIIPALLGRGFFLSSILDTFENMLEEYSSFRRNTSKEVSSVSQVHTTDTCERDVCDSGYRQEYTFEDKLGGEYPGAKYLEEVFFDEDTLGGEYPYTPHRDSDGYR